MTELHPRCSSCNNYNDSLTLGKDKIEGVSCCMCGYPLSEDDCFV
jgi:hypothetical protein